MSEVKMGSEGLTVSKIGFGCMGVTAAFGKNISESQAVGLLRVAYNLGSTHFDTGELSTAGNPFGRRMHEGVVGRFVTTIPRGSFTIATKFNKNMHNNKYDVKTVTESVNASLARLGLQEIDLYYLYKMPDTVEELLEWMASAKALVELGKIKYIGLCNASPDWIRAAHAVHPVSVVQADWSVVHREVETNGTIELCKELDIGFVAFNPLARVLFKHMDSKMANYAQNQATLAAINKLAAAKRVSAVQICLAWLYHQAARLGVNCVAIPGTSKIPHAQSNIASLRLSLTDEQLDSLFPAVERAD
jgi:aryl-alcohol dehydrogenase-like predicted oxidoreductase